MAPRAPLDPRTIEAGLHTHRVGRAVLCFGEVGSTNEIARDAVAQGGTDGLVITAESQSAGRGRFGRAWVSPPGANLLFSVLLIDETRCLPRQAVTIAAGLAVAEGIAEATAIETSLKWPNDVLRDGAKLAGILVERFTAGRAEVLVIGAGINVHAAPPADAVDRPATCLAEHCSEADRSAVLHAVLGRLDHWLVAVADGQVELLHRAWIGRCDTIQQRITARCDGRDIVGRVIDIDPLGGLEIVDDRGTHHHLPAESTTLL
jgi:BirA family transcriptional regulator, biotin operon repressor / biotin---[acetyl-CoA-carboxylase] ligase